MSVLSEEFAVAAANATRQARNKALAAGIPVPFMDAHGRYFEEYPDGRLMEIFFDSEDSLKAKHDSERELAPR